MIFKTAAARQTVQREIVLGKPLWMGVLGDARFYLDPIHHRGAEFTEAHRGF
jgi:hypothetical protein